MGFPALYRQRRPRSSGLWQALDTRFEEFQAVYEERFETRFGPLRPVVIKRVQEYLKCGILDYGFARVRCPECKHEYLVAFSCKARGFCPSCQSKRQAEFAAFLTEDVLAPVPHRQVVLSVPRRLRPYFFHHRTLLAKLAWCGYETVRDLIREALGADDRVPGAVVSVQTFGSLLDFHPHLHMLASWGGFDKSGVFHPVEAVPSEETVSRLFRHKVLKMLLKEGAIGEEIVENMLSWNHTGFGADIGPALAPDVSADRPPQPGVGDSGTFAPFLSHDVCREEAAADRSDPHVRPPLMIPLVPATALQAWRSIIPARPPPARQIRPAPPLLETDYNSGMSAGQQRHPGLHRS